MKRKEIVVYVNEKLSKEERKNFRKDHPGYRLAFPSRYPYFSLQLSAISTIISIIAVISILIRTGRL